MFKTFLTFFGFLISCSAPAQDSPAFITNKGAVHFVSSAPLEIIEATSDKLQGVLDPRKNTFAFRLDMGSIIGFNSGTQQDHFNENFMDSARFPAAFFTGKIIEEVDLNKDGEYLIRAKGKLELHGVARERIIKGRVTVEEGKIQIYSQFTVLLEEHNLNVPKIVYQKIAEEIVVTIEAELLKQKM